MGEIVKKQALTGFDILTVLLYRTGIIVSALFFIYTTFLIYFLNTKLPGSVLFEGNSPVLIFWLFIAAVNLSVSLLHLYSKKILKIIRATTISGTGILLLLAISGGLDFRAMLLSEGWNGKMAVIGTGLVLAGFSGIGAKEAFCFKLLEGYVYGLLLAFTVLIQLAGLLNPVFGFWMIALISALITVFTIRKMVLPLHYDIGDKSRY